MGIPEEERITAMIYNEELEYMPIRLPQKAPEGDYHAWHLYVIRLTDEAKIGRDEFIKKMSDKGIGCSVHFIPLHLYPYWSQMYGLRPEDFPNALDSYNRSVSLPIYTKMTDSDQQRVIKAVKEILS